MSLDRRDIKIIFNAVVAIILFCHIQIVFSSNLELNVFTVGQSNFTMLVNDKDALIFDCGYGAGCKKSD